MPVSLRDVQALFWRAMTWPTGVEDFLAQADAETVAAFERTFAETPAFGRRARMDVYADAYFWRLHDVLADEFPVARWLIGPQRFRNLATDFVLERPSREPDLGRFAAGLAAFVEGHPIGTEVPPLLDVIRVERVMTESLVAADERLLARDDLAAVAPEQWPGLELSLATSSKLVELGWDFGVPWRGQRDAADAAAVLGTMAPQPTTRLVWRARDLSVYHRNVDAGEGAALAAVASGATFADVGMVAAQTSDAQPDAVARWLARWVEDGLLAIPG